MKTTLSSHNGRRIRNRIVGAIAAAGWLAVSATMGVQPVLAGQCDNITFSGGTVSPGNGNGSTAFTFSVKVAAASKGGAPSSVKVVLGGTSISLSPSGSDYVAGVVFAGTDSLSPGTWPYVFRAKFSNGKTCDGTNVSPGSVFVSGPSTPPPTPVPTPRPTATPTAPPEPTPTTTAPPTPAPTGTGAPAPGKTPKPGPGSTPGSIGNPTMRPSSSGGHPDATTGPTVASSTTASPTPSPAPAAATTTQNAGKGGPRFSFDLVTLIGPAPNPGVVWLVTTIGGLGLFLALARRGAARGVDETMQLAIAGVLGGQAVASPGSQVVSAGESEPGAPQVPRVRTFDQPPAADVERASIGYRRVRISSQPDAIKSTELGRLERGDEVEILDSHEGFLQIRTPDNVIGWILRQTIIG